MAQIYLHVPFCSSKCGYCAFYSEPAAAAPLIDAYLEKLEREIGDFSFPEPVETVFIGGGTPSLLDEDALRRLLRIIDCLPRPGGGEVTLEANPETLTPAKLALIREKVTRLSLGVQSFEQDHRIRLGRNCSDGAIEQALRWVGELAFPHFNCDLIYGIPGQTLTDWERDLEKAAAAGIDHLSAYSLTVEEGTRLVEEGIEPDEDLAVEMWELAGKFLAGQGIGRYEVSNYARPGAECRHNQEVWRGSLLYGFGPAAASWDGTKRYRQIADLDEWLKGAPPEIDILEPVARRNEIFAVNLRTAAGWEKDTYLKLPGATALEWQERLTQAGSVGREYPGLLFIEDERRIALSELGLLFWDEIALHFI